MKSEPVLTAAAPLGLVQAVVAVLVAFNIYHPSDQQVVAIIALAGVVGTIAAFVARSKVTPVSIVSAVYRSITSGDVVATTAAPADEAVRQDTAAPVQSTPTPAGDPLFTAPTA